MAATLTIDRSNLPGSLADLVIGVDPDDGFTLDPSLSIGSITWRKETSEAANVAGREMVDYTRDTSVVTGSVTCWGTDADDLQDRIAELVEALTQVDPTDGFSKFTMTYTHDAAVYSWKCTEPADITLTNGALDDAEMAQFFQSFSFEIVRNPIPTAGPI